MGSSRLALKTMPKQANQRVRYRPPEVSIAMRRWFLSYAGGYVRRNLHTIRVAEQHHVLSVAGLPVLLYMNHPSWWDPMVAAVLASHYFPSAMHYAPIDAAALQKYKFFAKLGFFGITPGEPASMRKLLEIGGQVLSRNNSVLWLTPQARFSDARERPLRLGSGLAHLVQRSPNCVVLPMAIEYAFWEERSPEALVRFGSPVAGRDLREAANLPNFFELHLEENMDALARSSIARDSKAFATILSGKTGVGGIYDSWRRLRARLRGEQFHAEHGSRL